MANRRLILVLLAGLALGSAIATFAYSATAADDPPAGPPTFDAAHSDLTIDGAAAFPDFPLYSVGQSFEGLPLTGMTRRLEARVAPDPVRANFVGFRYGDCTPGPDAGCPAPLEIQVWPACERNLSSYSLTPLGDPLPHESLSVRGVPAAFFEEGQRLEVYTGSVSVVLFGEDSASLLRAADVLQAVNRPDGPGPREALPAPATGALEGRLPC
jgi:hypothetical protein